ncbi:MAG: sulfurtransferase TusA family protein [Cellvibrionaceae bacterium]
MGVVLKRDKVKVLVLNLRGLRCPLPILRLKRAIKEIANGEIRVVTTDPDSVNDFFEYARLNNFPIEHKQEGSEYWFTLNVGNDDAES